MLQPNRTSGAHYDDLLAPIYTWMLGGWPVALAHARASLQALGVPLAGAGQQAIDLGCGPGAHVVSLRELGYVTTAVDANASLLDQVCNHAPEALALQDDMVHAAKATPQGFDVVLCLGDTLAHLPSMATAFEFLTDCAALLAPGGMLALSFRDQSDRLPGERGLFLVRSDANRILTCSVEHTAQRVIVTDMLHEMSPEGWVLRSSSYDKLPINATVVTEHLRGCGLTVQGLDLANGMCGLVAVRQRGLTPCFARVNEPTATLSAL